MMINNDKDSSPDSLKLHIWQRIAVSLIAYPIIYLIIPASDVINFFIASLLFSAILFISSKWKDNEKARLPEWEGEESKNDRKKGTS